MVEDILRERLYSHFRNCGVLVSLNDNEEFTPTKDQYRAAHTHQRSEKIYKNKLFLEKNISVFSNYFADGDEVLPEKIKVEIELVEDKKSSELFRLISLNWSIPVSEGYGRRMRFIVWDRSNEKIIGILALGDAVFNIKARDD